MGSTAVFYSLWFAMLGEDGGGGGQEGGGGEEAHAADDDGLNKKPKKNKKHQKKGQKPVAALATFVRRRGRPQLIALVPHALVEDAQGNGEQLEPPGFDVIYLPAADEVRPVAAPNATGTLPAYVGRPPFRRASEGAISAAERLVRGLDLDKVVVGEGKDGNGEEEEEIPFDPSEIGNPALARLYSVLESLALGEAIPPAESTVDGTLPKRENTARAVELARGLAAAVGGALDDGEGAGGGGGGGSARARRGGGEQEATVAEIEADARAGLNLMVDEIQRALVARGLKKSGKKEELLLRLRGALD